MKKNIFPIILLTVGVAVLSSCFAFSSVGKTSHHLEGDKGVQPKKQLQMVYFNPEVFPDVAEIKSPSYQSFFWAVSDKTSKMAEVKMQRLQNTMAYDSVDVQTIREICENNNSDLVVVPKIKFFKVGIGKYVFSNQVVVSMKLFDAEGNLVAESSYDTYKKNKRMLGSTENSIKIGTEGAMNQLVKKVREARKISG